MATQDSIYLQHLKRLFIKRYFDDLKKFISTEFPQKWVSFQFIGTHKADAFKYERVYPSEAWGKHSQKEPGVGGSYRYVEPIKGERLYDVGMFSCNKGKYTDIKDDELSRAVYRAAATFLTLTDSNGRNTSNWLRSIRAVMIPGEINASSLPSSICEFDPMFKFLMMSFDKTECVYTGIPSGTDIELRRYIARFGELLKEPAYADNSDWLANIGNSYCRPSELPMPFPYLDLLRKLRNKVSAHDNRTLSRLEDMELFTIFTGIAIVFYAQTMLGASASNSDTTAMTVTCRVPKGYKIDGAEKRNGAYLLMPHTQYTMRKCDNIEAAAAIISVTHDYLSIAVDENGNVTEYECVYLPETETERRINELLAKLLEQAADPQSAGIDSQKIAQELNSSLQNQTEASRQYLIHYLTEISQLISDYVADLAPLIKKAQEDVAEIKDITKDTLKKVEEESETQKEIAKDTKETHKKLDEQTEILKEIQKRPQKTEEPKPIDPNRGDDVPGPSLWPRIIKTCGVAAIVAVLIGIAGLGVYLRKATTPLPYNWMVYTAAALGNIDAPYIKACEEEEQAKSLYFDWRNQDVSSPEHISYAGQTQLREKVRSSGKWYRYAIKKYDAAIEADSAANSERAMRTALMYLSGKGGNYDRNLALKYAKKASPSINQGLVALISCYKGDDATAKDILERLEYNKRPLDNFALITKYAYAVLEDSIGNDALDNLQKISGISDNSEEEFTHAEAAFVLSILTDEGYINKKGTLSKSLIYKVAILEDLITDFHLLAVCDLYDIYIKINPKSKEAQNLILMAWDMGATTVAPLLQRLSTFGIMDISDIQDQVYEAASKISGDYNNFNVLMSDVERNLHYGHKTEALETYKKIFENKDIYNLSPHDFNKFTSGFLQLGGTMDLYPDTTNAPFDSLAFNADENYINGIYYAKGYGSVPKDSLKADSLIRRAAADGNLGAKKVLALQILYSHTVEAGRYQKWGFEFRTLNEKGKIPFNESSVERFGAINIPREQYFQALDSAKTLLTDIATLGDDQAQVLMAFICDQLGDKAESKKWHKKALEQYNIYAVNHEVLSHEYLTYADSLTINEDIRLLENAIASDNFMHPQENLYALQRLYILASKLNDPVYLMGTHKLYNELVRFWADVSVEFNDIFFATEAELSYFLVYYLYSLKKYSTASYVFKKYAILALRNQAITPEDVKLFNLEKSWAPKLSDPALIYPFMLKYFPETELAIINDLGYDPFVNVREKGTPVGGYLNTIPSGEPHLLSFRKWEESYPLAYFHLYPW